MELSFTEAQRDFNEDTWYLQKALYDVNALKTLPVSRDLQTQLRHRLVKSLQVAHAGCR